MKQIIEFDNIVQHILLDPRIGGRIRELDARSNLGYKVAAKARQVCGMPALQLYTSL